MLKVKLETHDIWPEFDRLFSKDHFKFHTTFAYLCLKRVYKAIDFDCLSEYPKELQQEYARFICLKVLSNDVMELPPILSPSYRVDQVWHTHMLNPVAYVKMCYLLYPEEKIVIAHSQTPRVDISRYKNTLAIYKNTFLIDVDEIIWGNEDKQQYSSRVALIERERQKHRVSMGSTKEPKKHALLNHTESIIKKTKLTEATHIVLRVSNGTKTLGFKISRTNPFSTLLKSFCDQTGNSIDEVKFRIDGKPIMDHDTAEGLDLEDGDVIEATTPLKTVEPELEVGDIIEATTPLKTVEPELEVGGIIEAATPLKAVDPDAYINVIMRDYSGVSRPIRLRMGTPLGALMKAFCKRKGMNMVSIFFMYDSCRIHALQTAMDLDIIEGGVIEVHQIQSGC